MDKKSRKKKAKQKLKASKPSIRLPIPPNKRHKSKKDYKRKNKIKVHEADT